MRRIFDALDRQQLIPVNGHRFMVNPLTEQVPYTSAELLREACAALAAQVDTRRTTKLLAEEDRGAILLAGVSLITGLPFGMVRSLPNQLPGQLRQPCSMEYASFDLYLNGVEAGDRVTIVDDMISTGGTLIAVIKLVQQSGAEIVDLICLAEKINYQGRERVKRETGYDVQALFQVDVGGEVSRVIGPRPGPETT